MAVEGRQLPLILEVLLPDFIVVLEDRIILAVELDLQFLAFVLEEFDGELFGYVSDVFEFHVVAELLLLQLFEQVLVLYGFFHINVGSLIRATNLSRSFLVQILIGSEACLLDCLPIEECGSFVLRHEVRAILLKKVELAWVVVRHVK